MQAEIGGGRREEEEEEDDEEEEEEETVRRSTIRWAGRIPSWIFTAAYENTVKPFEPLGQKAERGSDGASR